METLSLASSSSTMHLTTPASSSTDSSHPPSPPPTRRTGRKRRWQTTSRSGNNNSSPSRTWTSFAAAALLTVTVCASGDFPSVDFDALGQVGIVGAFSGLEIWNSTLANSRASMNESLNVGAATVLARASNGSLIELGSTNVGGSVRALCQLGGKNPALYLGGNFSSIGGVAANNVASWNPSTNTWTAVADGIRGGLVEAVYCDTEHQSVVVGGQFGAPTTTTNASAYGGNVAIWDPVGAKWSPPDFGGLNGAVRTISAGSNSSMVRFGGSFSLNFDASAIAGATGSVGGLGSSAVNTSASPITSGLAPLSLAQSELSGGPAANIAGFENPAQILCPQGSDGAGNSYLFGDGIVGQLTVRTFRQTPARAFRIGNTFYQGRGTKAFSIVSIPDNTPLQLIYLDPVTRQNATCTESCPLAQMPGIPFQDFLISDTPSNNAPGGIKTLTGFQFTALEHYGAGAGLHLLEILSAGSWAYAYDASNRGACSSPEVGANGTYSGTTSKGGWYTSTYSDVVNTAESYLALTGPSNDFVSANSGAQVAWNVDTPITGNYSVYMQIPGCQPTSTCGERISVDVTMINNSTNSGTTITVDQNVQQTTSVLVFQGQIEGASPSFMPSVVVSLPANANTASATAGTVTVVADRVNFQLVNSSFLPLTSQNAFGLLEYNLFDSASTSSLTLQPGALLPNSTITPLDTFAVALRAAGVASNTSEYVAAIASVAGRTFVAGTFRAGNGDSRSLTPTNSSNPNDFSAIVSFVDASTGANLTVLPGAGLLGSVTGLAVVGNQLFVGGNFSSTADGKTRLLNVARFDPVANTWSPLGDAGGLAGPVTSVSTLGSTDVLFTGDFNNTGNGASTGGYAFWNTTANAWQMQAPLLVGGLAVGVGASDDDANSLSYLAGPLAVLSSNSAPSVVTMENPQTNSIYPTIVALNFAFDLGNGQATLGNMTRRAIEYTGHLIRRGLAAAAVVAGEQSAQSGRSLLPRWVQSLQLLQRDDPLQPPSLFSDDRNQVLATAFWKQPDGSFAQIVGGNFTTTEDIENIGIYDQANKTLLRLPPQARNADRSVGARVDVVRALLVVNDTLFVGGDGGMALFDLTSHSWSNKVAALRASKATASVSKLVHRPDSTTVLASGTFDQAGSLPCPSVCEWDMNAMRWIQLGTGFAGTVTDLDFANNKAGTLVVAGSLFVNGVFASLAGWSFDNATWTPYGTIGSGSTQIPGPATAMTVDDFQINSIFVAGRNSDGSQPFLVRWDGSAFSDLSQGELLQDTGVAQLTMFPVNQAHAKNDILETNRVLVVSGSLALKDHGNVSSAFYDGNSWTPFLRAIDSNGESGIVRGVVRSTEVLKFPNVGMLAVGLVILISIAIGLGIVFLLVLLGLIFALTRRRPKEQFVVPVSASDDSLVPAETKPGSLLATLNAATENVMGAGERRSVQDDGYYSSSSGARAAATGAGAAAVAAGYNSSSSGHRGGGESSSSGQRRQNEHARMDSAAFGTNDHSDETRTSTNYHSDGAVTGRSGYYTTDSSQEQQHRNLSVGAAAAGAGAGAAGAGLHADPSWEEMASGDETQGFIAHARYSFEATHPSELSVHAGQQLHILSDEDDSWWLARDGQGQRGVVPATYVL